MRAHAWLAPLGLVAAVALVAAACQTVPYTGRSQLQLLSPAQEDQMGVQAYQQILGKARLSTDATLNAMVTRVGSRNILREYATIHRGTKEDTATVIGNNNYLMGLSHVAHNCQLGNNVILCNGALLAGYTVVEDKAFISGNVVVHQFTRLGMLSMMSGGGATSKDVPPFMIVAGRSEVYGVNLVGMRRAGFSRESIRQIKEAYLLLFKSGLATKTSLEKLESGSAGPVTKELRYLLDFIKNSKIGICRPKVEERGSWRSAPTQEEAEEVL